MSNVNELQAGRELDELVARAIGAPEVTDPAELGRRLVDDPHTVIVIKFEDDDCWTPIKPLRGPWSPSSDLGSARDVVTYLRNHWGTFELTAGLSWHCRECEPRVTDAWGVADTAPLAICRAAVARATPTPPGAAEALP